MIQKYFECGSGFHATWPEGVDDGQRGFGGRGVLGEKVDLRTG